MSRIATRFVPVTLNADRLPATPAGDFFRALLKRWPQGLWVVTPDGETLGFSYHRPTPGDTYKQNVARWIAATCAMLDEAAQKAGPLTPRTVAATNPFPDRGVGLTADNGVRFALSVTEVRGVRPVGDPVFDSFTLTAADWASFAPQQQKTWAIPESTVRRFAPAMSPLTDSIFVPRPGDMTEMQITAARDGHVIRYRVSLKSRHLRDGQAGHVITANLAGAGVGDLDASGKLVRLMLMLNGDFSKDSGVRPEPIAAVVEWRSK